LKSIETGEGEELKISTKGRYGLRALIDLAVYSINSPVPINSIAARQDISQRYLEQLMAMLKKAELVKSIRGAGGGYFLARPAEEITVGDVLRALEGDIEPVKCAGFEPDDICQAADSCVTKYVWQKINDTINEAVDEMRISDLAEESRKVNQQDSCGKKNCGN